MKSTTRALLILLSLALVIGVATAQKGKPWTEWNKNYTLKILNDSGWGQTQTETDTSEMTWSTASRPITGQGAINQATGWNFYIRFLSAKPIRQALARLAELDPGKNGPAQIKEARAYADRKFEDTVVVAVDYEGKDNRFTGSVFQAFSSAITSTLKNNTYLELKGGKRIFLQEYRPPTTGGPGAIFIFPRIVDGKPLLDPKSGTVRFFAEFPVLGGNNPQVKLNWPFKVSDMIYEGNIEY